MALNCTALDVNVNFKEYADLLRNVTTNNITVAAMQQCQRQICRARYGTGNPDISGIGVIVGYFIDFALASMLALSLTATHWCKYSRLQKACRQVTAAYADSAIALAVAVELAAAIMLIKKNFGLSPADFGDLTVHVVWLVSVLVALPIITFCWQDLHDHRSTLRLTAISLAFFSFLLVFLNRMIIEYAPGQVGSGREAVVSEKEAAQISLLCFGASSPLSTSGEMVTEVFSVGGSLWISCNCVASLISNLFSRHWRVVAARRKWLRCCQNEMQVVAAMVSMFVVCSCPLFWAFMKLRTWQTFFTRTIGGEDSGSSWSFGQIMAVIVFLPVPMEALHQYLKYKVACVDGQDEENLGRRIGSNET